MLSTFHRSHVSDQEGRTKVQLRSILGGENQSNVRDSLGATPHVGRFVCNVELLMVNDLATSFVR